MLIILFILIFQPLFFITQITCYYIYPNNNSNNFLIYIIWTKQRFKFFVQIKHNSKLLIQIKRVQIATIYTHLPNKTFIIVLENTVSKHVLNEERLCSTKFTILNINKHVSYKIMPIRLYQTIKFYESLVFNLY